MNSGKLIGIMATVIAFGLTALAGLWLAAQTSSGELSTGGLLIGAFAAFVIVAPLFGFGIFMFVRGGQEAERESEMARQRRLLDIVRSRGQVRVDDLALEMQSSVADVKNMVHQLVGLQVFSGYVNWKDGGGTLYSVDAQSLRELSECKNCGGRIELAGKGVATCRFCGTEYFLS